MRNGDSVMDSMQLLYESNLPLIKTFINPYAVYEPMEDLLQEACFGLWKAVRFGRKFIGIYVSEEYLEISKRRLEKVYGDAKEY